MIKKKNFHEEELFLLVTYILKAFSFLHRMNIIHRDLKPENILLSDDSDLSSGKLIDFGLSALEKKKKSIEWVHLFICLHKWYMAIIPLQVICGLLEL